MQQKFLTGEDNQHLDYSRIDEDETLDDHWLQEANRDAEEKYFADDQDWQTGTLLITTLKTCVELSWVHVFMINTINSVGLGL